MLLQIHFRLTRFFFKVVFTVGRYDLKVRLHYGILLARFGPMLVKNSLNFSAIDFASCISILLTIRCLGNVSLLHFFLPIISFIIFHHFLMSFSNNLILFR